MNTGRSSAIPEIQTVPIPQEILEEIETFEDEVSRLQSGETPMDLFKPFRLQYGIYGQRQPDVQMIRIKIPFGGLDANQLRRIAELSLSEPNPTGRTIALVRGQTRAHDAFVQGAWVAVCAVAVDGALYRGARAGLTMHARATGGGIVDRVIRTALPEVAGVGCAGIAVIALAVFRLARAPQTIGGAQFGTTLAA